MLQGILNLFRSGSKVTGSWVVGIVVEVIIAILQANGQPTPPQGSGLVLPGTMSLRTLGKEAKKDE